MSRTLKIAIAAIAFSLVAAPALAQTGAKGVETVSIVVPHTDLDTSKPSAGAALLKRIEGAARKACRGARSQIAPHVEAQCRREAVETSVRRANFDTLTLAWSGRSPVTDVASR